jgi:major membrane immunogen (membrane-anchored lipoprotein)
MANVQLQSGKVRDIYAGTGNDTGSWHFKDCPYSAIQATVTGTGAVACVATIQVSNDGVNAVATSAGVITLSGTTSSSDGFVMSDSPWKYIRAVVSGSSGTISSISVTVGG